MSNQVETYDGQREGCNYVNYDNKFWNHQINQVIFEQGDVFRKAFHIMDTITFGILSEIAWAIEVDNYISRAIVDVVIDDIAIPKGPVSIQTEKSEDNGFTINGVNSTEAIRNLKYMTGLPINELERRMLPDNRSFDELDKKGYFGSNESFGGFIKPDESLIDIMKADNDYVLDRGYTHQDVARPMFRIINAFILANKHKLKLLRFDLNNETYFLEEHGFPMFQDSPFNDGMSVPGINISLTKQSTKDKFFFPILCPYLISRYGFYEGKVDYRIEPKKALDFFYGVKNR